MSSSKTPSKKGIFTRIWLSLFTPKKNQTGQLLEEKWQNWCEKAGICTKCLQHTAHVFLMLCLFSPAAQAEIPQSQAIRAIIGEASSEGKIGMTAVAEAIRNRGHLGGVYGLKAKHVDREPEWVWNLARKAWEDSAKTNLVKGADHWENTEDFGVPYWAKSMQQTARVGKHTFYKVKS